MFFFAFPRRYARVYDPPVLTGLLVLLTLASFAASGSARAAWAAVGGLSAGITALLGLNQALLSAGVIAAFLNVYLVWLFGAVLEDQLKAWRFAPLYALGALLGASAVPGGVLSGALTGGVAVLAGFALIRNHRLPLEIAWFGWLFMWIRYDHFDVPGWVSAIIYWAIMGSLIPLSSHFGFDPPLLFSAGLSYFVGVLAALVTGQWGASTREAAEVHASAYYRTGLEQQADRHIETVRTFSAEERAQRALTALAANERDPAAHARVAQSVDELMAEGMLAEAARTWAAAERIAPATVPLDAGVLHDMGTEAEKAGQLDDAAQAFFSAHRGAPYTPLGEHALFRLAHIYLELGRTVDGANTWRAFEATYPESGWRSRAHPALSGAPDGATSSA